VQPWRDRVEREIGTKTQTQENPLSLLYLHASGVRTTVVLLFCYCSFAKPPQPESLASAEHVLISFDRQVKGGRSTAVLAKSLTDSPQSCIQWSTSIDPLTSMSFDSARHEGDNVVNELGAESSMQVVSGAAPKNDNDGAWVASSSREASSRSKQKAPSRKSGTVNATTRGAAKGEGRRKLSYNLQCSRCGKPGTWNDRRQLCPKNEGCKRWVHRE